MATTAVNFTPTPVSWNRDTAETPFTFGIQYQDYAGHEGRRRNSIVPPSDRGYAATVPSPFYIPVALRRKLLFSCFSAGALLYFLVSMNLNKNQLREIYGRFVLAIAFKVNVSQSAIKTFIQMSGIENLKYA